MSREELLVIALVVGRAGWRDGGGSARNKQGWGYQRRNSKSQLPQFTPLQQEHRQAAVHQPKSLPNLMQA